MLKARVPNKSPWAQGEDEIAVPETFKTDTKMCYIYTLKKTTCSDSYIFIINNF
jgi:hypothetical protein